MGLALLAKFTHRPPLSQRGEFHAKRQSKKAISRLDFPAHIDKAHFSCNQKFMQQYRLLFSMAALCKVRPII